jgi:polyisoprenoid-binding protein YceI
MATTKWVIDQDHSEIQFKVKHLAIANVSGRFKSFSGSVDSVNESFDDAMVTLEIQTNSLDTNNSERDKHLVSELFLNSSHFPKINFSGKLIKENDQYVLRGDITILQTTKSITFEVEYTGIGTGRFNDVRAGFEIKGKLNRKDFGLAFNLLNEAGNLVVGEEVKLSAEIELISRSS